MLANSQELSTVSPTPFLKWAGGKGQLLEVFESYFPRAWNTYYEPFLGGGAVFFRLISRNMITKAVVSDSNRDLINCYVAIRDSIENLLLSLQSLREANDKTFYYNHARRRFNELKLKTGLEGDIEKAALLIYLNKTCYNGLYRVNSRGEFNVPWGRYKNPNICNKRNLRALNHVLHRPGIRITCGDYAKAVRFAKEGDFVYFDPPYQPTSKTAAFTAYTAENFGLEDQIRLAKTFNELDSRGCFLMLSNSPLAESLYKGHGYRIERVKAARAINCVGSRRGPVDELVVINY